MPRPPRIHFAGGLYHTIARGNDGQKTFLDEKDYQVFVAQLGELKRTTPFSVYTYCLMPNHFHLLMETQRVPLSVIMQRLLTRYVKRFNIRHRRCGTAILRRTEPARTRQSNPESPAQTSSELSVTDRRSPTLGAQSNSRTSEQSLSGESSRIRKSLCTDCRPGDR